jgi:Protein of unknown function (DUF4058)
MTSPFPGVDPYLESEGLWPDFHASFITYWRDALIEALPDNYEARMDERISLVELPPEKIKRIEPDLAVSRRGPSPGSAPAASGVATLEPAMLPLVIEEEERQTFIEILRRPGRTLVAVLELLSPANKEEPGRSSYLAKRNALLRQPVHLVEVDFLLSGQRLPLAKAPPPGDFYAYVARAERRPICEVYAWSIRQPIPSIPIPLVHPDPDVRLDFAAVFKTAYERGRYAQSIDYNAPPPSSLSAEARSWTAQQIRSRPG